MSIDPLSEKSVSRIRNWLHACSSSHVACQSGGAHFNPTRLVEIQHSDGAWTLKLVCDIKEPRKYVALSYCWGCEALLKVATKRNNLAAYQQAIPWDDLPLTLRDAAIATYRIGFTYLWIDALCIVQDDGIGKTLEIAAMDKVYGQADLTIVASAADDASQGFLRDRTYPKTLSQSLKPEFSLFDLPWTTSNGRIGTVTLVPRDSTSPLRPHDRIHTRGWTFQERLLSRRVVEFSRSQTRWSCRHDVRGHLDGLTQHSPDEHQSYTMPTGVSGERPQNAVFDPEEDSGSREKTSVLSSVLLHSARPDLIRGSSIGLSDADITRSWETVVLAYSHRTLTDPSDRILAISGVAKAYASCTSLKYVAGLWGDTLPGSLLWIAVRITDMMPQLVRHRPRGRGVPSWSWASFDGPVNCETRPRLANAVDKLKARVSSLDIRPVLPDAPFGALEAASLTLEGYILHVQLLARSQPLASGRKARLQAGGREADLVFSLHLDPDGQEATGRENSNAAVLLLIGSDEARQNCRGLVLRDEGSGTYSRLGVFIGCLGLDCDIRRGRHRSRPRIELLPSVFKDEGLKREIVLV